MTHLRNLMLEELERRNYSQSTARAYLMTIKDFARYFRQPPDTLGPEHIRQYQAYLVRRAFRSLFTPLAPTGSSSCCPRRSAIYARMGDSTPTAFIASDVTGTWNCVTRSARF